MSRNLDKGTSRSISRAVDILRTGYWYDHLASQTGKRTPYAMGKNLQPETYRKNCDAIPFSHNLWPKYVRGAVIPSDALLQHVERLVPGSLVYFKHIVFDVIDPATSSDHTSDVLLRRLHPDVQLVVFDKKSLKHGTFRRRKSLSRVLALLEHQDPLYALAATIILLREAYDAGDDERAFAIGRSVHRMLLIAGAIGAGNSVSLELTLAVTALVLPLASSRGRMYASSVAEAHTQRFWLSHTILQLEDRMRIGGVLPKDYWIAASKVLSGDYGYDLGCGTRPRLELSDKSGPPPLTSKLDVLRNNTLRSWGWNVLQGFDYEPFIPAAVLVDISAKEQELRDEAKAGGATS